MNDDTNPANPASRTPLVGETGTGTVTFTRIGETINEMRSMRHRHILIGRFFFVTTLVFLALAVTFAVLYITK